MKEISPEWTEQERLIVIAQIAAEMAKFKKPLFTYDEVLEWAQRLSHLATWPAEYLELNRANILKGN